MSCCILVKSYTMKLPVVTFHILLVSEEMGFLKQNSLSTILLLLLLINGNILLYFNRGSPKEASFKVSLNWAQLLSFKGNVL